MTRQNFAAQGADTISPPQSLPNASGQGDLEKVGAEIVKDWPPLTPEQLHRLDAVLNLPDVSEDAA